VIYMLYRVRQFLKGITPHTPIEREQFLKMYLTPQESILFYRLPRHERSHAMDTAWTINNIGGYIDKEVLIKAAMLHDIGKIQGKSGIIKKSILVLMNKFLPSLSYNLSGRLKMFYIYYNHPEIGAKMLERVNTDKHTVELVRYHHSDGHNEIVGMEILKDADCLN
jgi:putative nucleotidyltransferase with HDIG domain